MQFRQVTNIKTNITSALDLRPSQDIFALMTRQLAKNSSKYVYRLELYNFVKLKKLSSVDVYESYEESKHFVRFIADYNRLVVTTKFQIHFYQIQPLQLKKSFIHEQKNLYDLTASPDGQLVVLVGEFIKVWRTNGYRSAIFPHIITSARYCAFSQDSRYMAISSNNQINIYQYQRNQGEYIFTQLTSVQSPAQNQDITSINFNPTDSNELVVGFLNVSPQFFRIDTGFFIPMEDIQPKASSNAKKAIFMPDGKRFLSSDYRNGIGIWPGIGQRLFYKEGYLLYDLHPNAIGTRFLGYVWQQVRVVDIEIECSPQNYGTSCPCDNSQIWDYSSYSCQTLVCLQSEFSTGQRKNNSCVCIEGYKFDKALRRCVVDCEKIPHAVALNSNNNFCYCRDNYSWNSQGRSCLFNCENVPYSTGSLATDTSCECLNGFQWSVQLNQCVCPQYRRPLGNSCICYDQYFEDQNGKCIIDCSQIVNSNGSEPSQQQCSCVDGHYFAQLDKLVGCKLDCTQFNNTLTLNPGFDTCLCVENMNWVGNKCVIDCTQVEYASGASTEIDNACNCAVNYLWIQEIHQCGKNCTGLNYVNQTKKSTLRACPCIEKFNWNQATNRCQVDCTQINNTSPYSLANPFECQCRDAFSWVPDNYTCQIDCEMIWDANKRVTDDQCSCNKDKKFNKTKLTCDVASQQSIFSNPWTIVGLVVGVVIFLIIMGVLLKFCWGFKTQHNRQHDKKLKTNDNLATKSKKRKSKRDLLSNNILSDDRLKTKTTL